MATLQQLADRRKEILAELASLDQIRRGSLVQQYLTVTLRDGSKVKRGPYVLYSFKEGGKTVSKRLTDKQHIPLYKRQIENFRQFQRLTAELLSIGERLSALMMPMDEVKKTSRHRRR
jgi:hypothetical protein